MYRVVKGLIKVQSIDFGFVHLFLTLSIYLSMPTYACTSVCMYVCMYVHIIFIYTQIGR